MLNTIKELLVAVGTGWLVVMLGCLYFIVRHGLPWFVGKVKSIFNSAKEDLTWLDSRVTVLEGMIGVTTPGKPVTAVKVAAQAPVVVPTAPAVPATPVA